MAISFALFFTECKKDDDTHLQTKGNYVTTGTNNNTVQTFSFTVSAWTLSGSYWYYDYFFPSVTNMNGGVFVYWQSGTTYIGLPITIIDQEFYYKYDTGGWVEVDVRSASGNTSIPSPSLYNFKIVVIPPAARVANPNVNYKNYEEVKNAFNLKD